MTRRPVSNEEFIEAYGDLNAPIDTLTDKQKNNRKIMKAVASRFNKLIPEEDLSSCAMEALWRCLGYHQENRNQKFTTSLWRFLLWEFRRELRKRNKPNSCQLLFFDKDVIDIPQSESHEDICHLRDCISLLPADDKQLIQEYYFDKFTMEEIGKKHKYSKENARLKIIRALRKLKEIYNTEK